MQLTTHIEFRFAVFVPLLLPKDVAQRYLKVATDDSHCLHSWEYIRAAQWEGWSHFFSSAIWNVRSSSNGVFGYYKTTWERSGSPGSYTYTECSTTPCARNLITHDKWWHETCLDAEPDDDRGVEMDWLKFFWNAWGTDNFSMASDLLPIWNELPNDNTYEWKWNVPGASPVEGVRQAADIELNQDELNDFTARGVAAGVDNI